MDFQKKIAQFDDSIRRGLVTDVQKLIEALNPQDIPREFAAAFADLARRVRFEDWGIELLQQFIHPHENANFKNSQASPEELCAYAGLLIKIGAVNEAHEILITLNPEKTLNTFVFLSSPNFAFRSSNSLLIISRIAPGDDNSSINSLTLFLISLYSFSIFSLSRAASFRNCMSKIA